MISEERHIHSRFGCRQLADLLQAIFIKELIFPSQCLWIISPWITDIPVIDNRANQFFSLEPDWEHRLVRLTEILEKLVTRGTLIRIVTRPDDHNTPFIENIKKLSSIRKNPEQVKIHCKNELHEKGILGDDFYLSGSMNFTFNGVNINDEKVILHLGQTVISENRIVIQTRWEGVN